MTYRPSPVLRFPLHRTHEQAHQKIIRNAPITTAISNLAGGRIAA
jgi:hypothetical protein